MHTTRKSRAHAFQCRPRIHRHPESGQLSAYGYHRETSPHLAALAREGALAFLEQVTAVPRAPFFVFVHLRDVHCGPDLKTKGKPLYDSPPEFRDRFLPHPEIETNHVPEDIWENKVQLQEEELQALGYVNERFPA